MKERLALIYVVDRTTYFKFKLHNPKLKSLEKPKSCRPCCNFLSQQWDVFFSLKTTVATMDGNPRISRGVFLRLGTRAVKKRTLIIGLKPDNCSRETLLRLLNLVVVRGDSVLAIHVQHSDDTFDPNTFHIHEDICKSKQVDFEVKICTGNCYITELTHQVRIKYAEILAIGCSSQCVKESTIAKFLKALPPTCSLLVMDNGGRILFQKTGTSQQGSSKKVLQSSISSPISVSYCCEETRPLVKKILSMPCSSTSSSSEQTDTSKITIAMKNHQFKHFSSKFFQRLATLELKACIRCFTYEELNRATKRFSTTMLIEEGKNSQVYHAILDNGHASVVKVLKAFRYSEENLCREVEMLSGLKHENIVQLLGYCWSKEMYAVVYNLLDSSLKQRKKQLNWSERMNVAVGVAKALEYLHSCNPPIIHRDVKSSNILLSENCTPQLSDFGAAAVHDLQTQESISACKKPIHVIGTYGYLAPEYVMYGKVDEKIDVYSYGVMLLELITGKEATLANSIPNQECLVLWARSLLTCGLSERLIDPNLNEDYDKDGMKIMMIVARLCLLHSSSRRPTMKKILGLIEEPDCWLEMQKVRDDHVCRIGCKNEIKGSKHAVNSDPSDFCL